MLLDEINNALVGLGVRVAKVEPMTRTLDNGRLKHLGVLEAGLGELQDVRGAARVGALDDVAVAATKGQVKLAGDDLHRAGEVARRRGAVAHGEELGHGGRLAVLRGVGEHGRVKVAGAEEVHVHANGRLGCNVPRGILAAEAVGNVGHGGKVGSKEEEADIVWALGEAGEDDGVGDGRVLRGEGVGHGGAKGVANVDLGGELVAREAAEAALVGGHCELVQSLDLEGELDLLYGVAVRGLCDAEAVPGQGGVAGLGQGVAHVGVVVVGKGVVPVGAVKANTVGENLERGGRARGGMAEGGSECVVFFDVEVVLSQKTLDVG